MLLTPNSRTAANSVATSRTLDCQAVILAGGLGTRMRPVTETIPKPMIPVCGKPFLQHQLELLRRNGADRALLLVSYLGEQIEQFFGGGESLGMQVSYAYEPSPLGTGGALKNAQPKLEDHFVVLNGDTYLDIDYAALVADFRKWNSSATIIAGRGWVPVVNNLAVTNDGRVTSYRKRNPEGMTHTDAGAIVLSRKVLADLPDHKVCSLEEEVFPHLIRKGEMRAWVTSEPFFDMGSPEGLRALEERLA